MYDSISLSLYISLSYIYIYIPGLSVLKLTPRQGTPTRAHSQPPEWRDVSG